MSLNSHQFFLWRNVDKSGLLRPSCKCDRKYVYIVHLQMAGLGQIVDGRDRHSGKEIELGDKELVAVGRNIVETAMMVERN